MLPLLLRACHTLRPPCISPYQRIVANPAGDRTECRLLDDMLHYYTLRRTADDVVVVAMVMSAHPHPRLAPLMRVQRS